MICIVQPKCGELMVVSRYPYALYYLLYSYMVDNASWIIDSYSACTWVLVTRIVVRWVGSGDGPYVDIYKI